MNFAFSDEQETIKDVADKIYRDHCDDAAVRNLYKDPQPCHRVLWKQLADTGLLAAILPPGYGGSDLGLTEMCLIVEGQGRSLAPIPLVETIVECAMTLSEHGSETLSNAVLPKIANGELMLSPVRSYQGYRGKLPLTVEKNSTDWILSGDSSLVAYAPLVGGFVVSAADESGAPWIAYVDAAQTGIKITEQKSVSGEVCGHINFQSVKVPEAHVLDYGEGAATIIEQQAQRTYTALAAKQVGVLQEGLQRAADYTKERKQFGKALASFQAVAQQTADAYMAVEALRGVYWRALSDIEQGRDASLSARVAKFWTAEAGHIAAHISLHVHGGIGQDLEYPAHRFFTWAKHNENYLGGGNVFAQQLGSHLCENLESVDL